MELGPKRATEPPAKSEGARDAKGPDAELQAVLRERGAATLVFRARDVEHGNTAALQRDMRRRMPRMRKARS